MARFYANITLQGPGCDEVIAWLRSQQRSAYVAAERGAVVVFHSDLSEQEVLAARLSQTLECPALLVMGFNETVLLYHLYQSGNQIDEYVSSPHEGLDLEAAPEGNPRLLCETFGRERVESNVTRILNRPTDPTRGYALAENRHGELVRALALPMLAVGCGFESIEIGELPAAPGFNPANLVRIA